MWAYYSESNVCYAYLVDVADAVAGWGPPFAVSNWFTRGWTLQELIAPACVQFYSQDWTAIGTNSERYSEIARITSLGTDALLRGLALDLFSTAERLSWAAHRKATKAGDEAYSLLGLFDVNMPLLYGEGREKAFVRLQEAIYNATADHSIFLFRHSQHNDAQPLLADSPMSFCNRVACDLCLSQKIRNVSSTFRYGDIVASDRWSTQAHEQIMTTVTRYRNEISTVLPLLPYKDVSSKLEYFDNNKPRVHITDVAVLNQRMERHPQGARCLLLHRENEIDATYRVQVLPAVLPCLGDLVFQLQMAKLLVCPGASNADSDNCIEAAFSMDIDMFQVETWDAKGCLDSSALSSKEGQNADFRATTRRSDGNKRPVQVSCRIIDRQEPNLLLTVRLIRMQEVWSIKEVCEQKKSSRERKLRPLSYSSVLADRCSCQRSNGIAVLVTLRRLPSSARSRDEHAVAKSHYRISVSYR
jgi:hypothetical protein